MIARATLVLASASIVACAHRRADDGALADSAIDRVVRRQARDIRACYDIGLSQLPALTGRVHIELVIEASGTTTGVAIRDSTLANADVERCLVDIASRWRFPSAPVARAVSFPLAFAPEEAVDTPPLPP